MSSGRMIRYRLTLVEDEVVKRQVETVLVGA